MTKGATDNTLYSDTYETRKSVHMMLDNGEIKVAKMNGYLIV